MPSKSRSDPEGRWNQRSKVALSPEGLSWTRARGIDGRSSSRCGASAKVLARPAAMQRERLERAHAGCLAEGFARRELATSGPWALLGTGLALRIALSVMTDRLPQGRRHAEVLVWEIRSLDHEQRAISDAAGRGVCAATVMAPLRYPIHALAALGFARDRILELSGREINVASDEHFPTALTGLVDNNRRQVRIASAGHLPASLIADGRAEYLELPSGPPLGGVSGEAEKIRQRGILRRRHG